MSILFDNPPPAIGCGDPGDPIDYSCLFDGNADLSRTLTQNGTSLKSGTWCEWVKRSGSGAMALFDTVLFSPNRDFGLAFTANDALDFYYIVTNYVFRYTTTRRFRGSADHFFLLIGWNFDEEDGAYRVTIEINGDMVASFATTLGPSEGLTTIFNTNSTTLRIGRYGGGASGYFKGKRSNIIFIDGPKLTSSDFGYVNSHNVFVHRRFSGIGQGETAYGKNGFHLDFADPFDLGKDISGNGNHFTVTGLTVDHQTTDTPTNNVSNFNPLVRSSGPSRALSNGNREVQLTGSGSSAFLDQIALVGRKTVWRAKMTAYSAGAGTNAYIGLRLAEALDGSNLLTSGSLMCFQTGGTILPDGTSGTGGATWAVDDILDLVWNPETATLEIYVNDALEWSATYPAWIGKSVIMGVAVFVSGGGASNVQWVIEDGAGHDAFPQRATSMLCPAILNPDDYFTVRKVGDTTPLPWSPLVHKTLAVTKDRDGSTSWRGNDTVRGDGKAWACDVGGAEINEGANGVSWTTAGPLYGSAAQYQGNRITWFWRVSPKAGFDIVEINHVNGTPSTVAHKAGGLIEYAWVVPLDGGDVREFHHRLAPGEFLRMNDYDYPLGVDAGWFSSTGNSVTLGASMTSGRYIAYLWRAVPQFSAFELYGGTGNADGEFLPLDFEARLHLFRRKNAAASCTAICADIETSNPAKRYTRLTLPNPESTEAGLELDIYSNGTKPRGLAAAMNYNGHTYLTADWALTPGKFARAR